MIGGVFLWASGNDSVYRTCFLQAARTHREATNPSWNLLVCLNLQARGLMVGCVMFVSPPTAIREGVMFVSGPIKFDNV